MLKLGFVARKGDHPLLEISNWDEKASANQVSVAGRSVHRGRKVACPTKEGKISTLFKGKGGG